MTAAKPEIPIPACRCLSRPEAADPKVALHVPGCPRLEAIVEKYRPKDKR